MKYRFRRTKEIVDVISYSQGVDRSENDWVSYIDSKGIEHHREKGINLYWDFEIAPCNDDMCFLRWEYKVEKNFVSDDELMDVLNRYSKDGWELVSTMDGQLSKLLIFRKHIMDSFICRSL